MPTATAIMPPSAIGVSNTRCFAVLLLQPLGDPEDAAVEPDILAEDHDVGVARQHHVHRRIQRLHHRHCRAWLHDPQLLALAAQVPTGISLKTSSNIVLALKCGALSKVP